MTCRDHMTTDTMQRRVPLPLARRFLLFGRPTLIATNTEPVLRSAEMAGFVPAAPGNIFSEMRWEIVGFEPSSPAADWECNVTLGDHSLYLSMGREQWFALDLETHDGAGFVAICDSNLNYEMNAKQYFSSIACHVGASLPGQLESNVYD